MGSMELTRDWLQTVARPYASRERLVQEVIDVLSARRTLAVKTDAYTFDSGQTSLLVLLHGTLPISFRGATYHIPVNVWLPHDYPRSPPLAYVVPTKDMGVRKGKEVEPGGRVKEDVVAAWWGSWQDKSIEVLLKQLAAVFSAVPPVYAKPAAPASPARQPSASTANANQQSQPPPPARPSESLPQYNPPASGSSSSYVPGHIRQSSIPQTYASPPRSPIVIDGQPPIPARPMQGPPFRQGSLPPSSPIRNGTPPVPHRPYMQMPGQMSSGPASPSTGPAPPPRPQSIHGQLPPGNYQPAVHPMQHAANGQYEAGPPPPIPQHPPPQPYYQQSHPGATAVQPSQSAPIPTVQQPRLHVQTRPMDLMSGADDEDESPTLGTAPGAPPPVPPSKPPPPSTLHLHSILLPHLQASLPPLLHQLHANKTHLLERKDDLESGEPAIKDEMARLQAVKKVCDSTGRKMEEVVQAGSARVADLEQRGETSVDEVVCGISIVHNQLIDLVAEDNAIEDTIYHVTRALEAERIDMDRFLKSIRSLAREQYMKRALIERILQGMGQKQW